MNWKHGFGSLFFDSLSSSTCEVPLEHRYRFSLVTISCLDPCGIVVAVIAHNLNLQFDQGVIEAVICSHNGVPKVYFTRLWCIFRF